MKNFKKIASAIAALSLAACVAVPMSATVFTASAVNVTFSNEEGTNHSYEYYKVFNGKAEKSNMNKETGEAEKVTLTNVTWTDEEKGKALLEALKKEGTFGSDAANDFYSCTTAQDVANVLSEKVDNKSAKAKKFAKLVVTNFTGLGVAMTKSGDNYTIPNDGYYVIAETSAAITNGAKTLYLLGVVDGDSADPIEIAVKASAPTVDKQVLDNDDKDATTVAEQGKVAAGTDEPGLAFENGYWGETADHSIGDNFNFKLKATLPNDADINEYTSYKMVFHDNWSAGITYGGDENVKVVVKSGTKSSTVSYSDFTSKGITVKTGESISDDSEEEFQLEITNVKALLPDETTLAGATVEVIYTAKLNDNADVDNIYTTKSDNKNDVYLEYSNNPNVGGEGETGKTTTDTVWVFTYEVDNKKTAGDTSSALPDAKFKLYKGDQSEQSATTLGDTGAVKFSKKTIGELDASKEMYVPDETGSTEIKSLTDGTFNFYGLDAGTYTLFETEAPAGYNLAEPVVITITATHQEDEGSTNNSGTLTITSQQKGASAPTTIVGESPDGDAEGVINIVDNKGATLPSTGGIGTTLFYLGGGALVAVAGVMLITKKRMTKE